MMNFYEECIMDAKRFLSRDMEYYKASDVRRILAVTEKKRVISFGGGLPDLSQFPLVEAVKSLEKMLFTHSDKALQYSPTKGISLFLETLQDYMVQEFSLNKKDYDDIMVTTGSQQGLDLVSRALIDPGDIIIVEKPTYLAALNAFRARKPVFIGIEQDNDGMKTDELESVLKRLAIEGKKPKFIYTVPTNQNPAGTTMPDERRKHLYELAVKYDTLILEDDPYSPLTFEGRPPKPIKCLDNEGRVIFMSTLSKTLSPGLRIGWLLGDSLLIDSFQLIKQVADLQTSTMTQYIAREWIKRGIHKKLLEKTLPIYKTKKDIMLESMEKYFPQNVRWTRPKGGMFLFVYLPEKINSRKMLETAIQKGVVYVPGDDFYPDSSGSNTMRLNYTYPTPNEIERGIKILGKVIKSYQ
jgi:2-aminoadipate transaminase